MTQIAVGLPEGFYLFLIIVQIVNQTKTSKNKPFFYARFITSSHQFSNFLNKQLIEHAKVSIRMNKNMIWKEKWFHLNDNAIRVAKEH